MKIQSMAVMFIIIILPISMIFASYTGTRVQTLSLQASYDSKLNNATYDAIKAFQLNTINSATSDLTNSKMRDLKAAVNTFFTSVASHFGMSGYDKNALQEYVPALVFTLYDGYYIYSPYANVWDEETIQKTNNYEQSGSEATYHGKQPNESGKETLYGLKPYIYYSCRYKNSSCDVVITYSLDSYVTIKGLVNNQPIDEKGYLLTAAKNTTGNVTYRDFTIENQEMQEMVAIDGNIEGPYSYQKIRGVKHYYDPATREVFEVFNGKKVPTPEIDVTDFENNMGNAAVNYYNTAIQFRNKILSIPGLKDLRVSDAVDESGAPLTDVFGNSTDLIFGELNSSTKNIEDEDSVFNNHRMAVIRYSIERNLSIAIANYNNASGAQSEINFQMPKLKDYEWDKLYSNIGMISFLQGLNIGGKIYNGYSVISNNKNEEFIAEDSFYVLTADGVYHRVKDSDLQENTLAGAKVILNVDFEVKKTETSSGATRYYYLYENAFGCYQSVVNQNGILSGSIHDVVKRNSRLASLYYTALGRERYTMNRIEVWH